MRCPVLECRYKGTRGQLTLHMNNHHPQAGGALAGTLRIRPFMEIRAFRGYLRTYRHRYRTRFRVINTVDEYFTEVRTPVRNIISVNTVGNRTIKLQVTVVCEFERGDPTTMDYETCIHYVNSNMKPIYSIEDFQDFYDMVFDEVNSIVEIFQIHGSGWRLKRIRGGDIRIAKLSSIRRGRCFFELPQELKKKRAVINVRNMYDKSCFKWAVLSVLHYSDMKNGNRQKISNYKAFVNQYNFTAVEQPPNMNSISKFEKDNMNKKIAVNVLEYFENEITIKRISPLVNNPGYKKCDVLLVHDDESGQSHYVGIPSISRLFGKSNCHKKFFCYNCQCFYGKTKFESHINECLKHGCQKLTMPALNKDKSKPVMKFKNFKKQLPHEYVLYLDLESILTPVNIKKGKATELKSEHQPSGFFLVLVSRRKRIVDYKLYRGEKVVKTLFETLDEFANVVYQIYRDNVPMKQLTPDQYREYNNATTCYLCKQPLAASDKAKDHDHLTGEYRGVCHYTCNSRYTLKKSKIPIFTHGFRNYDLHLIFSGFKYTAGEIVIIPTNTEKYISVICEDYIFLDSYMFLSASLDTLVSRLKSNESDFSKNFKRLIQYFGENKARELCRKGVYFYDYITSHKMFSQTEFPGYKKFYNVLTESNISKEDYEYGTYIFNKYCTDLGSYHDLYLICGTILLACVMENFRDIAFQFYGLDPAHYVTLSSFSWDALLKTTNIELELLTDIEMYQFFEAGLRGGLAMISKRKASSNNKYMKDFDNTKDSSYIIPWDCNSLYSYCLSECMPYKNFKWMRKREMNELSSNDILNWKDDSPIGYVLQVDLQYPSKLHNRDNEYPLAAERLQVDHNSLSNFQKKLLLTSNTNYTGKIPKLVPHLGSRTQYVIHYRNLKYYLQKGTKLTKIWKVLTFYQKPWLKPYIEFNIQQRQIAKDQFSKDLFKFLCNTTFGKSCENVRKRRNIFIVRDESECEKITKKTNFKSFDIYSSDLALVELRKGTVSLDKPIYIGFTCLEISKLVMYEFHFDVIKKKYGANAELLMTDTDSLCYHIKTDDIYKP